MAIELIVETGQSATNSNTYVSTATIDSWLETNPHDNTWSSLTQPQKNGYAVMSCRVLNEQINWDGWQTDDEQALDLPRSGMVDRHGNFIDNDEIPAEVQNAQSELARLLAISDRTADADTAGFKEIGVGTIKLVIDKADRASVLADSVFQIIRAFGNKMTPKGISQVIRT